MKKEIQDEDVQEAYTIDHDKIIPGDIILTAANTKSSKLIRMATQSKYSHALLHLERSLIHATLDGIYTKNPQREIVDKKESISIFRLKKKLTTSDFKKIKDFALSQVGSVYSIKEAISSISKDTALSKHNAHLQFCSRLVAQSYKNANIYLVDNPDYCTPEDICKSSLLEKVDAVKKASKKELDIARKPDLPYINQERTYQWLKRTRKLADSKGFIINAQCDVFKFLSSYPEYDDFVVEYIKESNWLEVAEEDYEANSFRYNTAEFHIMLRGDPNNIQSTIKKELDQTEYNLRRFIDDYQYYNSLDTNLNYISIHKVLYKKLIRQCIKQMTTEIEMVHYFGCNIDINYNLYSEGLSLIN